MEQALVRFGRFVNDMEGGGKGTKYVELAKFLLDGRYNAARNDRERSEYDQSHLPVTQQYEAVGHAVRAMYNYSGMADVAVETHDPDYQSAVKSLWDNMVNKKYYVTGGVGSGETSEGFGPNYSLRNRAYCESCSSCGAIFFQWKMNLAYHDAKYADLYEETMYNALLGSTDLAGEELLLHQPAGCQRGPRAVAHLPVLRGQHSAHPADDADLGVCQERRRRLRQPVRRQHDHSRECRRDRRRDGAGHRLSVERQGRDYGEPEDAEELQPAHPRADRDVSSLYRSTPEANGITSIAVNGQTVKPVIEKGYAVITRAWKAGDKVDVVLPMKVQRVHASEQDRGHAQQGGAALRSAGLQHRAGGSGHQQGPEPGFPADHRVAGRSVGRRHGDQRQVRRWQPDDGDPQLRAHQPRQGTAPGGSLAARRRWSRTAGPASAHLDSLDSGELKTATSPHHRDTIEARWRYGH